MNNPIYYPPQEIIENSEVFVDLPQETALQLDALWAEVKMGGPGDSMTLVLTLAGFLALYLAVVIYKKVKRNREC